VTYGPNLVWGPISQRWWIYQYNPGNNVSLADFIGFQYTVLVIKP
jgi:hypothetical protein